MIIRLTEKSVPPTRTEGWSILILSAVFDLAGNMCAPTAPQKILLRSLHGMIRGSAYSSIIIWQTSSLGRAKESRCNMQRSRSQDSGFLVKALAMLGHTGAAALAYDSMETVEELILRGREKGRTMVGGMVKVKPAKLHANSRSATGGVREQRQSTEYPLSIERLVCPKVSMDRPTVGADVWPTPDQRGHKSRSTTMYRVA